MQERVGLLDFDGFVRGLSVWAITMMGFLVWDRFTGANTPFAVIVLAPFTGVALLFMMLLLCESIQSPTGRRLVGSLCFAVVVLFLVFTLLTRFPSHRVEAPVALFISWFAYVGVSFGRFVDERPREGVSIQYLKNSESPDLPPVRLSEPAKGSSSAAEPAYHEPLRIGKFI